MTLLDQLSGATRQSPAALATERLLLRPPHSSDANSIAALINDRRIAENMARTPHPYSVADAQAFIARAKGGADELDFLVTLTDGRIIGGCGICKLDGKTPEIGYWFGVPYWGNGFATETARALVDHAFADLGYDLLVAGARVSNPASRRVLEKCGFQWTNVSLRRVRALASSTPCDRFRLDRSLWASLKRWGKVKRVA